MLDVNPFCPAAIVIPAVEEDLLLRLDRLVALWASDWCCTDKKGRGFAPSTQDSVRYY